VDPSAACTCGAAQWSRPEAGMHAFRLACLYSVETRDDALSYRCPNGPPGTDPARTRFGPVRIGPGQARPVDASGRVGLAHVPSDMPKPGTHREKSCRAGPLARWASTDRAGHWPEPTVERYINTYI
jgi:hypothetical protein